MRNRMIECNWLDTVSSEFNAELTMECINRSGILADVIGEVAENKINLIAANARPVKDKTALISITVQVDCKPQIDNLIKKLHRIPGVYEIKRSVQ